MHRLGFRLLAALLLSLPVLAAPPRLSSGLSRPGRVLAQPEPAAQLRLLGRLPGASPALSIAIGGTVAALPAHARGIHLVDIKDPERPRLLATAPTRGQAYDAVFLGGRLAVASWKGGLELFDLTDPAAPRPLGRAATHSNARSVAALPGGVVVTGSWSATDFEGGDPDYGLEFWDIQTDPPTRLAELKTPGWAGDLATQGTLVFVADGPGGVRVVDAADPRAPRELGSLATEVRAYGIDVAAGGRLYVADNAGGLFVVDAADPAAPRVLGHLAPGGAAYGVAAAGDRVWLAEALGGDPSAAGRVTLIDASDPTDLQVLAGLDTERRAWGVALDASGRAFVAATDAGLLALAAEVAEVGWRVVLPWLDPGRPAGP